MKKKILSLCLAFLIAFGVLCTPISVFAESSETTLYDEVEGNFPSFELSKYENDESETPRLIGTFLFPETDTLSIYIYNPQGNKVQYLRAGFEANLKTSDDYYYGNGISYTKRSFYYDNRSDDDKLWKFSFNFKDLLGTTWKYVRGITANFIFDEIVVGYNGSTYTFGDLVYATFELQDGKVVKKQLKYNDSLVDVHLTSYIGGNDGADLYRK